MSASFRSASTLRQLRLGGISLQLPREDVDGGVRRTTSALADPLPKDKRIRMQPEAENETPLSLAAFSIRLSIGLACRTRHRPPPNLLRKGSNRPAMPFGDRRVPKLPVDRPCQEASFLQERHASLCEFGRFRQCARRAAHRRGRREPRRRSSCRNHSSRRSQSSRGGFSWRNARASSK